MRTFLDFEKPVADLQGKIQELRRLSESESGVAETGGEIATLEAKAQDALKSIYSKLTPWQKTQVARHPDRPQTSAYIAGLITEFAELAGDRNYGDDKAILCGLGRFRGRPVAVLGQEKGADTQSRLAHNFGMARPEGYRKAVRLMKLADRFGMPVISFVDTA
ncbi:MAG: carboxyl transferase domain-containing protein, partial [Alphaproteobacteria bacterium]